MTLLAQPDSPRMYLSFVCALFSAWTLSGFVFIWGINIVPVLLLPPQGMVGPNPHTCKCLNLGTKLSSLTVRKI